MIASFVEIGRGGLRLQHDRQRGPAGRARGHREPAPDVTDCDESRPIEDPYEPHWSIIGCAILAGKTLGMTPANVTVAYVTPPSTTLACSPTLHVGCIATVTVTYSTTSPPFVSRFIGPITMTQTSEMPVERVFP